MKRFNELLEEVKIGEDYYFIDTIKDLDKDIEVLQEGVRYFKTSQRLNKLTEKLRRKDMKELQPLIEITRRAAMEFERVEGKFERKEINKSQARMRISNLKRYYAALLKIVKHKDFSSVLKVGGITAILGGIIASIIFGFQPLQAIGVSLPKWETIKHSLGMLEGEVGRQLNALKRAFQTKVIPFAKGAIEGKL
jgi:hypothetical protein